MDVKRGVGIEDDDVVEVGSAVESFDNLADDLDEPHGRNTAALGHDEPLIETRGSAKRS